MQLDKATLDLIAQEVGTQASAKIAAEFKNYENKAKEIAEQALKGAITKEQYEELQKVQNSAIETVKSIVEKQGTTITELTAKIESGNQGGKSIIKTLDESKEEFKRIYDAGSGQKTFMVYVGKDGRFEMKPVDLSSAKATHATVDGVEAGTAAISSQISASTILRMAADSPIVSQYRNSPWVLDLCNLVNAGLEQQFAVWYEEQAPTGGSQTVPEGGTKPQQDFKYVLKSSQYKKEAVLVGFTDEFSMDFQKLQSDILGKARIDLMNSMNTKVLTALIAAATGYGTAAQFNGGVGIAGANDYHAIAAMAAQVDSNTFGANANTALMSTYKKYRMGTLETNDKGWLNRPDVLAGLSFVGNPGMAADGVLVGDLKQYNVILRGGMIVRVGYNGNNFAENKFSVVLEQYYYDYISAIRAQAIVKGTTFADVKGALAA